MKKIILALLLLCLMIPSISLATGGIFGPRLQDDRASATGEEMAWKLLEKAMAAENVQTGVGLVMKASAAAPESGDVQINCAYVLLSIDQEGGYFKEVEQLFRAALRLLDKDDPQRDSAIQMLAEVLVVDERAAEAVLFVQEIVEASQGDENLRLLLATTLYYDDRNDEALAVLEELAEDSPRNLDALRLRATILLSDCHWEDALEAYRQIDQGWPEYLEGKFGLYMTYTASGRFDRALRVIDEIILYNKNNSFWLDRAHLYLWKLYDPETALAEANALLRMDETWVDALGVRMSAYTMMGEYDAAYDAAEDIAALDKEYGQMMRGIVAMNARDWADAEEIFAALSEKYPDGYVALKYGGVTRLEGYDDPEAAMVLLGQAFSIPGAEEDYDLFVQLGYTYFRKGELLEAGRAFAQADRLTNEETRPLYCLAMLCVDAGRIDDMQNIVEEMERRYPGWYQTMLARTILEDIQDHHEEALARFEALVEKFPYQREWLVGLEGELRASVGDAQGAEMIKAAIDVGGERDAWRWVSYAVALTTLEEYDVAHAALDSAALLVSTAPDQAGEAHSLRINIATARAGVLLKEGDMDGCVKSLEEAIAEGWPPFALACYETFAEVYASEAYQAILERYPPQARDWDLTILPTIPTEKE